MPREALEDHRAREAVAAVAAGHEAAAGASTILTGVVTGLLIGLASVVVLLLTGFGKDRSTRLDLLMKYAIRLPGLLAEPKVA